MSKDEGEPIAKGCMEVLASFLLLAMNLFQMYEMVQLKREAVKAGAAHYVSDRETGKSVFTWRGCNPGDATEKLETED